MNRLAKFITVAGTMLLAATAVLTATNANAATAARPCTSGACYNDPAVLSNLGPWAAAIKPRTENFGQGGSPYLTGMRWHPYSHGKAVAYGKLHAIEAGCTPTYQCRYVVVKMRWVLTRPKWNSGQHGWYYSKGHLIYTRRGLAAQHYWHVTSRGYWQ